VNTPPNPRPGPLPGGIDAPAFDKGSQDPGRGDLLGRARGLLLTAGFAPADAARLYLAFIDTVLSHAATEAAFHALPRHQREADHRAWRDVYQDLDPQTYPSLTTVRPELPGMADSSFEQAVDLLLEALTARAQAGRHSHR
jgi:hypothetical protein